MKENQVHFCHLMPYFQKGEKKNTVQTAKKKKIYAVYGDSIIAESIAQKWFTRFQSANFYLANQEYSTRTAIIIYDQIEMEIKNNPDHTAHNSTEVLHM